MALRVKVLRKKAEKFEAKQLEVHKVDKERLSALESLLQDVFSIRRPKPNDYEVRRDLVRVFNDISKEIHGNSKKPPVVEEFGSFVMDLFSLTSDLDLSVNFDSNEANFPREKKIQTLRKFAKKLYALQSKGHVYGVLPITTAKVPIVKVVDRGTGVECDLSVENRDGILKSKIIHIISSIDERFHKLSFLMKNWAKAQNINSSKEKTLNSLSIILLVAFHFQTRNPPILPPFSAIFKDGTEPETVEKSVANFVGYGKRNKEYLAELFLTLLIKLYSVEKLWRKGICASTWEGSWISKTWNSKVACISVEDFTIRSQNVARAVGPAEVKRIHECIEISIEHVFSFLDGKLSSLTFKGLLFGPDYTRRPFPIDNPNSDELAALPGNSSRVNRSSKVKVGKKRKQGSIAVNVKKTKMVVATQNATVSDPNSVVQPRASWGGTYVGTPQPMAAPLPSPQPRAASLLVAGGWRGAQQAPAGSWGMLQQPKTIGWVGAQPPRAGDWEMIQPPTTIGSRGAQHHAGDWERVQHPARNWERAQHPSGDWERAQHTAGNWERAKYPAGNWERTQLPARDWERAQLPAGDWERAQLPAGNWERARLPAGDWEQARLPAGDWEGAQPSTQNSIARTWGGTSYHYWSNANTRNF